MNNLVQKFLVGSSAAALAASMPTLAQAQGTDIEQVVVSASRVTIAGYSQPTPVTVIGAAQLEQDGFANIQDSLRQLPQVNAPQASFSSGQTQTSGGTLGANFVNLRDMGRTRTLVLFDGQRMVAENFNGGVDITTLPSPVVSRIDVVTGGASASWGSDAVAGVVNFVINKNITGLKGTVDFGVTKNNRYRTFSVNAVWGDDIFGGRGHIEFAGMARISPDAVLITDMNWFKGAYWVSNPTYTPTNGQSQLIVATNVGLANQTAGGIINSSPAGVAGPGVTAAPANALRGIQFVGAGIPQRVDYGNLTLGTLSNGGSLTSRDTQYPESTIANPGNTYTFFGYGRYKLTDSIQASVQFNYGYFAGKAATASAVQTSILIKSDNAYIPASVRATMQAGGITSFTMGSLGVNNYNQYTATGATFFTQGEGSIVGIQKNRRNVYRGVFTLDGTLGDDWSWNAYIQHSHNRLFTHYLGLPIIANMTAAQDAVTVTTANRGTSNLPLGSIVCRSSLPGQAPVVAGTGVNAITAQPGCIPMNMFGEGVVSAAAIAYITGYTTNTADEFHQSLQQDAAEASMQGTLPWELPGGKVAVAFGAGWRKEMAWVRGTDISTVNGYTQGPTVHVPHVHYSVIEGFGEVNAPILKNSIVNALDFSMAGRMTSYSTSGLVETWKLGLTAQVNDDIKLRTTWSVDIRAPGLAELYNPAAIGLNTQRDPKTQLSVPSATVTAGNPNLNPEVARTVSGGVVLTPTFIPGLSFSADWYSINLTGRIGALNAANIVNACNATQPSPLHPGQNGNPNDPICRFLVFNGPGGALSGVNLLQINLAQDSTSGLDLQANYTMDFWEGSLSWLAIANLNDEHTLNQPGIGVNDYAGSNAQPVGGAGSPDAPGPKWRGVLSATYTAGPYSFTTQGRWYGTSIINQNGNTGNQANASTANLYDPHYFEEPFTAYLDLRASYKWNDNISFFGAIDNTLNTPPALLPGFSNFISPGPYGYYQSNQGVYDFLGRTFRMGIRFNY